MKNDKIHNPEENFDSQSFKASPPGWLTANRYYYPAVVEERQYLKRNMTHSEKILWEELKNKKLGFKFRRQHVIDVFIVDFVCLSAKLVVEVDGGIHKKQIDYDTMREERLMASGFLILRFTNEDVENDVNLVCAKIKEFLFSNRIQTPPDLPEGEERLSES